MKRDLTTCFNIRLAWHEISRMYQSYANEHEVSITLAYALLSFKKGELIKSTQIAPLLGMEASSLTRIIKTLENKKWITKEVGKNDKREVYIKLTEEGAKKREVARRIVRKFNLEIRNNIPKSELEIFMRTLKTINNISKMSHK